MFHSEHQKLPNQSCSSSFESCDPAHDRRFYDLHKRSGLLLCPVTGTAGHSDRLRDHFASSPDTPASPTHHGSSRHKLLFTLPLAPSTFVNSSIATRRHKFADAASLFPKPRSQSQSPNMSTANEPIILGIPVRRITPSSVGHFTWTLEEERTAVRFLLRHGLLDASQERPRCAQSINLAPLLAELGLCGLDSVFLYHTFDLSATQTRVGGVVRQEVLGKLTAIAENPKHWIARTGITPDSTCQNLDVDHGRVSQDQGQSHARYQPDITGNENEIKTQSQLYDTDDIEGEFDIMLTQLNDMTLSDSLRDE